MQNIIQAEDDVKGMPDQALQQMAQRPDGRYPQFLVVSEIQRRSNMRKRFESQQQPQGTVKDQIVQQGIASLAPPPPQIQQAMGVPQQMPQGAPMPPQMPPQGMYAGGVVNMNTGQQVPYVTYPQRQFGRGIPLPQLTEAGREATASLYGGITQQRPGELETLYRNELVGMPMEEYDALLAQGYTPTTTGGLSREGQPRDTVMFDPELAQRLTGSDKFRSEFFDTGMDSGINEDYNRAILAEFAQNNPEKAAEMVSSGNIRKFLEREDRLASYEGQYEADPILNPDPNALTDQMAAVKSRMKQYNDVIGSVAPNVDPEQDLMDMFNDPDFTLAAATPKVQPKDAAQIAGSNAAQEDAAKADPLATAQAQISAALGNKNQAVSAYQAMIDRANTRAAQYETEAATRASELQADAKKDMLANALIELGSGIAGGDFAGGLSRAGRTAADLKARVGAEARAEERSGREMAEAARQRAEGLTLEEMAKDKEEERYEQSIEIAAAKHASALAESERERQFRSTLSDKEINARVAQQTRQFAQDRIMFDEKVAQAEKEGALTRDAAGQAKLAKLISDYISSRSIQERLTNENFNDEAGRLEAEKALASQLQSQYSQYFNTDAVNFADRKASP